MSIRPFVVVVDLSEIAADINSHRYAPIEDVFANNQVIETLLSTGPTLDGVLHMEMTEVIAEVAVCDLEKASDAVTKLHSDILDRVKFHHTVGLISPVSIHNVGSTFYLEYEGI